MWLKVKRTTYFRPFSRRLEELVLTNPYFAEQDLYSIIDNKRNISVHEARRIVERLILALLKPITR